MPGPEDSGSLFRTHVRTGGGASCPIIAGPGASREAPGHLAGLAVSRCVVVTDSNLVATHAAAMAARLRASGWPCEVVSFPAGEIHKTRATKESIEDRMLAAGCGQDTAVIAVGGGVTGDMAGFVAATYMRGIPFIQMPTSLLAMADAAIGGKTGVDHPLGKNLIGAYHEPAAVLADTGFLATLPLAEFRSGLAEMVKAGVVADEALFEEIEACAADLAAGIRAAVVGPLAKSIAVKAAVVSADARESSLRQILNFGHTIGHAVEMLSGWKLTHGEAVAIGMVVESSLAVKCGLMEAASARRLEQLIETLGLPVALPAGVEAKAVLAAAATDKKARGGALRFALPGGIGRMAISETGEVSRQVGTGLLTQALDEAGRRG